MSLTVSDSTVKATTSPVCDGRQSTSSPRDYAAFTVDHRCHLACLENKASQSSLSLVTVSGGAERKLAKQYARETVVMQTASYTI